MGRDLEGHVIAAILLAWGAHPQLRLSRQNVGGAVIKGRFVKFGVPGTGDIVGLMKPSGRMIHLECKRVGGVRRAAQLMMQRTIRAFGGVYEFTYSLEEADAVFAALGLSR